jgi:hypothetical protein
MPKPKCDTLLMAIATAVLSTSTALADAKSDDRSYLPPQAKEHSEQAILQAKGRVNSVRGGTRHRQRYSYGIQRPKHRHYAHYRPRRRYAHWSTRRTYAYRSSIPGIFFGLFR